MNASGVSGANDMMMQLMQVLMKGMQEQMALSQEMIAVGVENSLGVQKMDIAQGIIDAYA